MELLAVELDVPQSGYRALSKDQSMLSLSPLLLLPIALQSAAPFEDLSALHQRMEAAAGTALQPIDPRLRLRLCPVPVQISVTGGTALAACAPYGWRVYAQPVLSGSGEALGPVIRRGDAVALRIPGRGFAVTMRAVALEDGAVGARIRLRSANGPPRPITATVVSAGEATP